MGNAIRVLLVDDEQAYLDQVSRWLIQRKYTVLTATSGDDAIRIVKEDPPDIIFLDINMPGKDGIVTLRAIKQIDNRIPVIMVTVVKDHSAFAEAHDLGCAGFFPKEGSLEELKNLLEVTVRTHKNLKSSP